MDWVERLRRNGSTVAPNGRTYRITTDQLDQWVIVRETPVAQGSSITMASVTLNQQEDGMSIIAATAICYALFVYVIPEAC